jgi:Chlorophyll A-B binding protein
MTKFTAALLASLAASSSAFVQKPAQSSATASVLKATGFEEVGGVPFDPLNLAKLGTGESFDTFPNMFPNTQYLQESEIKHGRQAMLAWTGVWATHEVGRGCCSWRSLSFLALLRFVELRTD